MHERRDPPIAGAYWLEAGAILAGEYPGAADEEAARDRLSRLLDAGIRTFVDLTEASEPLAPYVDVLRELAIERNLRVKHLRFAIRDASVPASPSHMREILSAIRAEVAERRPVYVHCWGGIGRTERWRGAGWSKAGSRGLTRLRISPNSAPERRTATVRLRRRPPSTPTSSPGRGTLIFRQYGMTGSPS